MTAPVPPYGYNKRESTMPAAPEDCLFLNVFVPGAIPVEPDTTAGLPVLVWIHGGGYAWGNAATYNGADLLIDSLNTVVVVVIQYRLGAFGISLLRMLTGWWLVSLIHALGFLAGNEVKAQGALNAGLLDQTFALQWVQDHIGVFGGDKARVTIWGESAGAGSVLQHIVANGGNTQPPLFHAAIVSSTFLPSQYHYNDRLPQVGAVSSCASTADTFTCLQSVEVDTLQAANHDLAGSAFYDTFNFVPVVDGTLILERPTVTLAKSQVNGQVLLAVSNQNEGNTFVYANETLTIADYVSQLFPDMTFAQVQEAASVYKNYGTAVEQAMMVMGDSIFVCPTYYLLHTFAGRSWKGLFAIPPAYHGQDAIYYFNSPSGPPPYNNTQFITAFAQSFISLARYYDVNVKFDPDNITPYWNKYYMGETEMLFNRTEAGAPVVLPIKTDPTLHERCTYVPLFLCCLGDTLLMLALIDARETESIRARTTYYPRFNGPVCERFNLCVMSILWTFSELCTITAK
ncbi:Alpha/Beta hydrolase protein [Boletus reticuloceps]|uniref:Carboxylic ester hydrolase n=1 Tax=Boletus reticuloceps TaxID=495285 RepID=A0A8I2YH59_9AGAM|nr:Alpha/Beta hydrolase protein [Boletus reticuloceps]